MAQSKPIQTRLHPFAYMAMLAICCSMLLVSSAFASDRIDRIRIVQSGHSLTDGIMDPLRDLVRAAGGAGHVIDKSTIPGSPMDWRWNNAASPDIRQPEIMAQYDLLVITERAPLSGTIQWHDSPRWALHWVNHAWAHGAGGAGARSVLYGTWVHVDSGSGSEDTRHDPEGHLSFRDRMPLEQARWDQILDHVNDNRPAGTPEMQMIPGPLIMAAAHDDIAAGRAPGLSHIGDLFSDNIHLNPLGGYLIALAHFAVIYDRDPRGLPHGVPSRGGPDHAQAAWMQDLVWRVLSEAARS